MVDTSERGDVDGLATDDTGGTDTGGIFAGSSVDHSVDEDLDAEDVTMVVEMLRDYNKIKVSLTCALVASV